MQKPNILLIMTDQQRNDCMGCAGNGVIQTPHLDGLARQGVRFEHAYSSVPSCTPARSGLLTGLSPWHHGMLGYGKIAPAYPFELPKALDQAGYYNFCIGKNHFNPPENLHGYHAGLLYEGRPAETGVESPGWESAYTKWFKEQAPGQDQWATGLGTNDYLGGVYALPEELHPTHWTGRAAVDLIEKYDEPQPFLLKVSFHRPHSPYDPPKRFLDMYHEEDMPAPFVGEWAARFAPRSTPENNIWFGDMGAAAAKHSRRAYYALVTQIDEQIGRILAALQKRGFDENTLIVFCTDHGDMLGDHHHWRKTYAYEGSAGIPMLLRWPASMGMAEKRGGVISNPVELRDVLPTFLDAARAPVPGNLDGRSLLPLVRGEGGWRDFIDLEHDRCYDDDNHWNALTDGNIKYIYQAFSGREQLFSLREDPGELRDLAADAGYRSKLEEMRARMVEHLSERGEAFVSEGKLALRKEKMLYSPLFPGAVQG